MTESRWTAPAPGWYRLVPGGEPEYLGPDQLEDTDLSGLLRIENDGVEVRGYQNSGGNITVHTAVLPNALWVTVPLDGHYSGYTCKR